MSEHEIVSGCLETELIPVTTGNLLEKADEMTDDGWRLATISARIALDGFETHYAFHKLGGGFKVLQLKSRKEEPIPSIHNPDKRWALFYETEAVDLLGLPVEGLEGLELFEPGRQSLGHSRTEESKEKAGLKDDELLTVPSAATPLHPEVPIEMDCIPLGPQHPILPEPVELDFILDGETIANLGVRIGHCHRGIEAALSRREYWKGISLAERICGICSGTHSFTSSRAVETLCEVEVPLRAQYLRVVLLELERVHSHLLTLGHLCEAVGFEAGFQDAFRIREVSMDLLEELSGNRVNYSYIKPGGVSRDLSESQRKSLLSKVAKYDVEIEQFQKDFVSDKAMLRRLKGKGIITVPQAVAANLTGPAVRGAGVPFDLRADGTSGYPEELRPPIRVEEGADLYARTMVRLAELTDSMALIQIGLEKLPEGDIITKVPKKLPAGKQAWVHNEAPRGEVTYHIVGDGTPVPERMKVRTPTLANLPGFVLALPNQNIEDAPGIIAGFDPCISCTER